MSILQTLITAAAPVYGSSAPTIARYLYEDLFQGQNRDETYLKQICQRLHQAEPWQYLVGQAPFLGHNIGVSPAVLIPRPETEEWVAAFIAKHQPSAGQNKKVLDLGTGSGCIAIALQLAFPNWTIHAADKSPQALAQAQQNAQALGANIHFHEMDGLSLEAWQALPPFDAILSNPPYIPKEEAKLMPPWVLEHEPHLALFTDEQGDALVFYRFLATHGPQLLQPQGEVWMELNEFWGKESLALFQDKSKWTSCELGLDYEGKERWIKAMR